MLEDEMWTTEIHYIVTMLAWRINELRCSGRSSAFTVRLANTGDALRREAERTKKRERSG